MSDAAYAELCRDPESYEHGTMQWSFMDMHESNLQEEYLSPDPTEEEDPEYWFWIWKHGKDGEGVGAERSKEVDHAKDKSSDYEIENDDYNHDDDCRDDYGDDYEDDYGDDNDFEDWTCGSPNY